MKLLNKDEFIANELRFGYIRDCLKEGDKLPSERDVAEQFGVQRATARSAYKILEDEGLIEKRERSGRYMCHPRMETNLQQIKSFSEKFDAMGIEAENKLLALELIEVDKEMCKKIKLPIGTPAYKITRIRSIFHLNETVPIAIEYAYIPEDMAPKLMKYGLEETSLFDILVNKYGKIPSREEQEMEVVYANDFEAKYLCVDKMTALVRKNGITYDEEGKVLQYLNSIMNKDWVEFKQSDDNISKKVNENLNGL